MRKASTSQHRDPLAELDRGEFRPVYLLLSEDAALADEFIARLRGKLVDPGLESFDFDALSADELDLTEARQRLRQLPVGAHRLVVIKGITRAGASGPVFSELGKPGTVTLCRELAEVQAPAHVAVTGLPKKELDPVLKESGLTRYVITIPAPRPDDLEALLARWARERKVKLAPGAARLLVDIAGSDTGTLKSEIEKLATCCPGETVTEQTVRELAGSSREFQLQDFVGRVLDRDPAAAVPVLRRLEEWGEETPKILYWLTTAFLDLVAVKAGSGLFYQKKRIGDSVSAWPDIEDINRCLQRLYRVNHAKLSGRPEDYARLELFTQCVACRGAQPGCELARDGREHDLCTHRRPRRRGAIRSDK